MVGSEPMEAKLLMRARGLKARLLARLLRADQHGGGAIHDAGRVAGRVHMVDALDLGIFLQGDGVEAVILAHVGEGRVERAERLHAGVGADHLVAGQQRDAENVVDRHDGVGEAAFLPGFRAARLWLSTE